MIYRSAEYLVSKSIVKRILKIIAKVLIAIIVCLSCFVGIVAYALNGLFLGMCSNEIFNEAMGPDRKLKAIVFQRDCGATTGFSTQISLIPSDYQLKDDEGGNVFIVDGHPQDHEIQLIWRSPNQLLISNASGLHPKKKKEKFKNVTISYE